MTAQVSQGLDLGWEAKSDKLGDSCPTCGAGGTWIGGLSEEVPLSASLVAPESSSAERGGVGSPDAKSVGGEICP